MPIKFERSIIKMGTSIGITLPKPWVDFYDLKIQDKVEVEVNDDLLTIRVKPKNEE